MKFLRTKLMLVCMALAPALSSAQTWVPFGTGNGWEVPANRAVMAWLRIQEAVPSASRAPTATLTAGPSLLVDPPTPPPLPPYPSITSLTRPVVAVARLAW